MMAKWESELQKVVDRSAANKKAIDGQMLLYAKAVDAAQAFIGAHSKSAPKLTTALAAMMDGREDCGRAAAELMVYEEDLDKAKKGKDKAKMKEIEAKMKPLINSFESSRKEINSAIDDLKKADQEILKPAAAATAAIAAM
jgi:phage-related tail protein